jgi:hypothetical protein
MTAIPPPSGHSGLTESSEFVREMLARFHAPCPYPVVPVRGDRSCLYHPAPLLARRSLPPPMSTPTSTPTPTAIGAACTHLDSL